MIRCVAIDDEPMALDIIENFCLRLGNIKLRTFANPIEGIDYVNENYTDIVLLDIDMGDVSGLSLVDRIPDGVSLVFTTAYSEYAVDGFNLDVVDFLHKPFSVERFEKAIEKAIRHKNVNHSNKNENDIVQIKEGYATKFVRTDDIMYIESMDSYVRIYTQDSQVFMPRLNIKKLENILPANIIRIHKSFMVNIDKISKLSHKELTLVNGIVLPLGRNYKINIKNIFNCHIP